MTGVGKGFPAGDGVVHDVVDLADVPLFWFLGPAPQRLPEQLTGAHDALFAPIQVVGDESGLGVLRHKVPLVPAQVVLHLPAEAEPEVAGAIDRHGLRPHLGQIGPGGRLVFQYVDFRPLGMHQHRHEPTVAGAVQWQKIHRVGGAAEHALTQPVGGMGLIGDLVGLLLPAEKSFDFLDASRIGCGDHLGHLDDPVSLHFAVHVLIIQPFQIVGEPVVPARQQAEEGGLARPLATHQAKHEFKLAARLKHPADGTQQKQPQRGFGVGVLVRAQKAVQAVPDAVFPVPHQGVEKIPDRMVAAFIGHHHDRVLQLLFHHQAIGFLEVHEQVLDVHIAQGGALPVPAQGLDHIHLPGEQIFADSPFQKWIALQYPFVVRHGVGDLAVLRVFQAEFHRLGGCQFPWFLSHLIRQYASPPAAVLFLFLFRFSFHIPPFAVGPDEPFL